MKQLNPIIEGRVSNELYEASIGWLNKPENVMRLNFGYKTRIIHLIDSVARGYTSPMEAYEALKAPYFPAYLETRESAYKHLL